MLTAVVNQLHSIMVLVYYHDFQTRGRAALNQVQQIEATEMLLDQIVKRFVVIQYLSTSIEVVNLSLQLIVLMLGTSL